MAIEKFLAMEDGEPGYTKTGTVTHVPFPAGGDGVQTTSSTGGPPWQQSNKVIVPFVNAADIRVEFTSLGYWAVTSVGANGAVQASAEFITEGIRTQREDYGGGTAAQVETISIPAQLHRWGVRFVGSYTIGLIEVWCDGVRIVNREMRTTASWEGSTVMNALRLSAPSSWGAIATFDSVVTGDEWLGDCHVDYLVPDGNGGTSQWVGSDSDSVDNWELVDEIPPSGADYVEADDVDLRDLYTVANLPASGTILGVQAVVHPWKLGPGAEIPTSTILKTGAGEHVDLIEGMSTAMQGLEAPIRTTRPGGGAWTVSDVNAMQIGVTTEEP